MLCYEYEKIREKRYSKTGPTKENKSIVILEDSMA